MSVAAVEPHAYVKTPDTPTICRNCGTAIKMGVEGNLFPLKMWIHINPYNLSSPSICRPTFAEPVEATL